MANVGKNALGQITINGVAKQMRGIYDAGFGPGGGQDMAGEIAQRNLARYTNKLNLYLHIQSGTFGNALRICDALEPLNMYTLAIANAFSIFELTDASNFDTIQNPPYTTSPEGTGAFCDLFQAKARSFGVYLADEPSDSASFSGNGTRTAFLVNGHINSVNEISVKVGGVLQSPGVYAITGVGGTSYTVTFATPPPPGTFNVEILRTTVIDSILHFSPIYKARMPNITRMVVLIQNPIYQLIKYAPNPDFCDFLLADPYEIGQGSELNPGSPTPPAVSTYGYMNFMVGEALAGVRFHALANNKVPGAVLQMFKFGTPSRYITDSELHSHMVMALCEFREACNILWWAMGTQAGAMDSTGFTSTVDHTRFLDKLDVMSTLLASLEPITIRPHNPNLMTLSTTTGDARTWRIALCTIYKNGAGDRPCWGAADVQHYTDEFNRLTAAVPDLTLSEQMLDQSSDIRAAAWELGTTGLAACYNLNPDPKSNVLHTWHVPIIRVEVLSEGRDCPVINGNQWLDGYGGGSSLRQGSFNQGHIYRVTLVGGAVQHAKLVGGGIGFSGEILSSS
jgi:hypothetical protein